MNNPADFELLLFTTKPDLVKLGSKAGINGFIVDWENQNKFDRQSGFDTQINFDTITDLASVRVSTSQKVICRINGYSEKTETDVKNAIEWGTDEILLPMVRSAVEVEQVLRLIDDRCELGILIETNEAVQVAGDFADLPLRRVYVGLNDLAIARNLDNIFTSIVDGTVEQIRSQIPHPFGFGGLTLVGYGAPVPCNLLMAELIRLDCSFSFLRRSFLRDIKGQNMADEINHISSKLGNLWRRNKREELSDKALLKAAVLSCNLSIEMKTGNP